MTVETYLLFVAPLLVLGFGAAVMALHEFSYRREPPPTVSARAPRRETRP